MKMLSLSIACAFFLCAAVFLASGHSATENQTPSLDKLHVNHLQVKSLQVTDKGGRVAISLWTTEEGAGICITSPDGHMTNIVAMENYRSIYFLNKDNPVGNFGISLGKDGNPSIQLLKVGEKMDQVRRVDPNKLIVSK